MFLVDLPSTQGYMRDRAPTLGEPLARLVWVPVDFGRDDLSEALAAAGHDPTVPTTWVWEGVTMYLDDAAVRWSPSRRSVSAPVRPSWR